MDGIALVVGAIVAGTAFLALLGRGIALVIVRQLLGYSAPDVILRRRYARARATAVEL